MRGVVRANRQHILRRRDVIARGQFRQLTQAKLSDNHA